MTVETTSLLAVAEVPFAVLLAQAYARGDAAADPFDADSVLRRLIVGDPNDPLTVSAFGSAI